MRAGRAHAAVLALVLALAPSVPQVLAVGGGQGGADAGGAAAATDPAAPAPSSTVATVVEPAPEPAPPSTVVPATATTAPPPVVAAPAPDERAIVAPPAAPGGRVAATSAPGGFAPASAAGDADGEVYALVVGIDDYPGDRFDLSYAVDDADTVDLALERFGVPPGNRLVLRDGQASRANLVGAIRSLVAQAGPGSTVVLAYAGHVRKLDHDTEALITAEGEVLTDRELATLLAPARADHMWLLLATCYAGGFTEALAPGRILTGAARADELAYENQRYGASYLVHHMVREGWLEGRSGPSVQAAFAYADARVAGTRPDRRPVQIDQTSEPLVLARQSPQPEGPPASSRPPEPQPERRCVLGVLLCTRR